LGYIFAADIMGLSAFF